MLDYRVSYYLGEMLHQYIVEAKNYYEATIKVLDSIPETSQYRFRDLKIERYYAEWN